MHTGSVKGDGNIKDNDKGTEMGSDKSKSDGSAEHAITVEHWSIPMTHHHI